MTIKELQILLKEYPENQFVHIRVWINEEKHFDTTLEKVQQGCDGAALLTTSIELLEE
jgi:hypothetical protein